MALFSMRVQVIKRSAGRSAVAAAAYRACEKLYDERQDMTHDYSRKGGVEHKEILLPDNAPAWVQGIDRETLWNAVEANELRKDSQVARELRVMIPREVPPAERLTLVRDYVRDNFVTKGMVADVCWHNKVATDGQEQPHAHIMLTMRPLAATAGDFGPKVRHDWVPDPTGRILPDGRPVMVASNAQSWNCPEYYERCREAWENIANAALEKAGSAERIDRRSLLERGLSRLPEPALRLAFYLNDLRGALKERFGHFQMARHYRAVEQRAKAAFDKIGTGPEDAAKATRTASRYIAWFERQLDRLSPASPISLQRQGPGHGEHGLASPRSPPSPDLER